MGTLTDALSSASLLLAAIALVYAAWSSSIDAEISRTYSAERNTLNDEKLLTRRVRNRRALPLAVGSWLILLVFLPRLWNLVVGTFDCLKQRGCDYDDVTAIFALTQIFVLGFALHLSGRVSSLNAKLK